MRGSRSSLRRRPPLASALLLSLVVSVALVLVGLGETPLPRAGASVTPPTWRDATAIPGLAALGVDESRLTAVACNGPGQCTAGGYTTEGTTVRSLLVEQVNGTWGDAREIPGMSNLPGTAGVDARVSSISCVPGGDCLVVGTYASGSGIRGFATRRIAGTWEDAVELPGLAALALGGLVSVYDSSCSSAGNCSAVGSYYTASSTFEAFVIDLVNGVWQSARNVPGLAALNTEGRAELLSVACPADGQCSATGYYKDGSGQRGFVVDRAGGIWGNATDIPGLAALDTLGGSTGTTISCSSPGNCSVGGRYAQSISGDTTAFLVDRVGGTWGSARPAFASGTGASEVTGISCPVDDRCHAVGIALIGPDFTVFVSGRAGAVWAEPTLLPGMAAMATESSARSISCAAPDTCAITGRYTDGGGQVPFVANLVDGVWGSALPIPGLAGHNSGVSSSGAEVACTSPVRCVAVGDATYAGVSAGFLVDYVGTFEPDPAPIPPRFTG
ncbi:MAG: hypothetical protein FGM58_03295 [Acidimicrobiia bacterium]|nr:hypothetical protein [Acidimicrobiia bacterium]